MKSNISPCLILVCKVWAHCHAPGVEGIAMSELQATSTGSGYAHHESPPTYHTAALYIFGALSVISFIIRAK